MYIYVIGFDPFWCKVKPTAMAPMAAPEFLGAAGDLLARAIDQRSASHDGRMGLQRLTMKNLVIQLQGGAPQL